MIMDANHVSQKTLMQSFDYKGGSLFWKVKLSPKTIIGDKAGYIDVHGYEKIVINKRKYASHRLIFLYKHGYLPKFIDHKDGDILNNKIENLRECTLNQNQWNMKLKPSNTSGTKGVSWDKSRNKWIAAIKVNGKRVFSKRFKRKEDAIEAVIKARKELHGDFCNHG
jgi:hypothetical protein